MVKRLLMKEPFDVDDTFEVFKNDQWQNLQMVDTNTTYNATQALVLNQDTLSLRLQRMHRLGRF